MMKPTVNPDTNVLNIVTPEGVAVKKDCFSLVARKDDAGEPILVKSGKRKGEQSFGQTIGLAVDKTSPEWPDFWEAIKNYADENCGPTVTANPAFAWKIKCGDTGRSVNDPTGYINPDYDPLECYKDCWIIWITSYHGRLAPVLAWDDNLGAYNSVDNMGIAPKPGDTIRVLLDVESNGILKYGDSKPGLYIGPQKMLFVAEGEEIVFEGTGVGSIKAEDAFGAPLTSPAPDVPNRVSPKEFTAPSAPPAPAPDVPLYQLGEAAPANYKSAEELIQVFQASDAAWTVELLKQHKYIV